MRKKAAKKTVVESAVPEVGERPVIETVIKKVVTGKRVDLVQAALKRAALAGKEDRELVKDPEVVTGEEEYTW